MTRGKLADRPTRLKLLLRRRRRLLRPAAWGVAGFVVVLTGIVLLHSAEGGGTIATLRERLGRAIDLRVADVEIDGRANTPEPLLRAALGVSRGDPILGFSVEGARQRIERLSWVEHVAVERRLPGTIVVSLTERRPIAVWQAQGRFTLIDRDGQVVAGQDISSGDWRSYSALPLVVGAGAPAATAALLDALTDQPQIRSRLVAAVRVGERRWNLQLRGGMTVLLPEGAAVPALARLMEVQGRDDVLDRPLATLDLRAPDRMVLHPAAAGAVGPAAAGAVGPAAPAGTAAPARRPA